MVCCLFAVSDLVPICKTSLAMLSLYFNSFLHFLYCVTADLGRLAMPFSIAFSPSVNVAISEFLLACLLFFGYLKGCLVSATVMMRCLSCAWRQYSK